MKAALVKESGATPVYADFTEPAVTDGVVRIAVVASALSHVTKSRASGKHYSASAKLPFVPGVDGTGVLKTARVCISCCPKRPSAAWPSTASSRRRVVFRCRRRWTR